MLEISKGRIAKRFSLGGTMITITPIDAKHISLDDATPEGELLEKRQIQKAEYKYFKPDGTEYSGQVAKLQNGEVVGKCELTKEIQKEEIKEVDTFRFFDVMPEHYYLVLNNDALKEQLKEKNVSLQFPYNSGYGYRQGVAIMTYVEKWNALVMVVGETLLSQIIANILGNRLLEEESKKTLKSVAGQVKLKAVKSVATF